MKQEESKDRGHKQTQGGSHCWNRRTSLHRGGWGRGRRRRDPSKRGNAKGKESAHRSDKAGGQEDGCGKNRNSRPGKKGRHKTNCSQKRRKGGLHGLKRVSGRPLASAVG